LIIFFQRKSGDVTTCFGNTLINMMALADCIDLSSAVAFYFVGDDSFIFMLVAIDLQYVTEQLMIGWNFEAKIIENKGFYFCSTFMVHDGISFRVMPDPLKRLERLSKPLKINDTETLRERWISFCDLMANYRNAAAVASLDDHVRLRYAGASGVMVAAQSFVALMDDYKLFESLYTDVPNYERDTAIKNIVLSRSYVVAAAPCSGKSTIVNSGKYPRVYDADELPALKPYLYKYLWQDVLLAPFIALIIQDIIESWVHEQKEPSILLIPWTDSFVYSDYQVKIPEDDYYRNVEKRKEKLRADGHNEFVIALKIADYISEYENTVGTFTDLEGLIKKLYIK
jgi:hypothetical protein